MRISIWDWSKVDVSWRFKLTTAFICTIRCNKLLYTATLHCTEQGLLMTRKSKWFRSRRMLKRQNFMLLPNNAKIYHWAKNRFQMTMFWVSKILLSSRIVKTNWKPCTNHCNIYSCKKALEKQQIEFGEKWIRRADDAIVYLYHEC